MSLPHLLTAADLADALGIGRWQVYDYAARGIIPSVRIGRSIRFDEDKIREWIDKGGSART